MPSPEVSYEWNPAIPISQFHLLGIYELLLRHHIIRVPTNQTEAETADTVRYEYQALLDLSDSAVMVLDCNGVIIRANALAGRLLGVSTNSPVGHTLLELTLSQSLHKLALASREESRTLFMESRIPEPDGKVLAVKISPILIDSKPSDMLILLARNITDLRRLETIRRDFVANVSHELRTPLASIRAMAETLQQGALEDTEVASKFLDTIINESQRLARISEDLLILSQAESRAPTKEPFDMEKLLRKVVQRFQPQADRSGINLSLDCPAPLQAFGSQDQIEQVIVNLIDNALKYTSEGGNVRVSGGMQEDGINVCVRDTGIGIMSKDLPRLFERFYRVDKARSRSSGGTGLGLSIVKHIVEAHGGNVTVESEYNHGSAFSFTLPNERDESENREE